MAARGGEAKRKVKTLTKPAKPFSFSMKAEELASLLDPLIARELATIGAIDSVAQHESQPGYVTLLRAAKTGKQASVEQMSTMIRAAGGQPTESATLSETILKLQSMTARRLGTTALLRAMRFVEIELVAAYTDAYGQLEGMLRLGLQKCLHRALKRLTVLTAHIAIRSARPEIEEQLALALPLEEYFANGEDRVCFRCLFDRPGHLPPLERSDPNPYTYLCAACHQDVLSDFPPDQLDSVARWSRHEHEAHVIERALSRPSKLTAEELVLAKMSGLAPDLPPRPLPRKVAQDASPKRRAPAQPRPRMELGGIADSPLEQAYSDALFDWETVRGSW